MENACVRTAHTLHVGYAAFLDLPLIEGRLKRKKSSMHNLFSLQNP